MGKIKYYLVWSIFLVNTMNILGQEIVHNPSGSKRLKSPSGFEYQIVRRGTSTESSALNSYIFFNLTLTEKDSVLQSTSSSGQPSILKVTKDLKSYGQLEPLVDLMVNLHRGDSFKFYFPVEMFNEIPLGYENFTEPLVYHVGIVNILDELEFQDYSNLVQREQSKKKQLITSRFPEIEAMARTTWEYYKMGELNEQMITTTSGLRFIIHDNGIEGSRPTKGSQVFVHYYGMLAETGKFFDSSFKVGQPYQFTLGKGQVIQGWEIGIPLLNRGAKATFFIPPLLGYGEKGATPVIPSNAELIFYVELIK